MNFLAVGFDSPKAHKGENMGFLTGILYLAPGTLSGVNLCPMSKIAGCEKACLNTAGFGSFDRVQQARIKRTKHLLENEDDFINDLVRDIYSLIKRAKNKELIPVVRLNGTSDILWERKAVKISEKTANKIGVISGLYKNIMNVFPNVQFYDYTKIPNRITPKNYDLTFSYSGVAKYQPLVQRAISNGMRIAVVFRNKNIIPKEFLGMKVISGDNSDVRHLDPKNVVISLYAKGKARTDNTGFVVDVLEGDVVK